MKQILTYNTLNPILVKSAGEKASTVQKKDFEIANKNLSEFH